MYEGLLNVNFSRNCDVHTYRNGKAESIRGTRRIHLLLRRATIGSINANQTIGLQINPTTGVTLRNTAARLRDRKQ